MKKQDRVILIKAASQIISKSTIIMQMQKWFGRKLYETLSFEGERPLTVDKHKEAIDVMKVKLGGELMKQFVSLKPVLKRWQWDDRENKLTKQNVVKLKSKFDICLIAKKQTHLKNSWNIKKITWTLMSYQKYLIFFVMKVKYCEDCNKNLKMLNIFSQ